MSQETKTDCEYLSDAIRYAKKNGYKMPHLEQAIFDENDDGPLRSSLRIWAIGLVLSHDFAKAVFGESDSKTLASGLPHVTRDYRPEWRERLQEMTVSINPFKYLSDYIEQKNFIRNRRVN